MNSKALAVGVAAMALCGAHAAHADPIGFCSGGRDGMYFQAANTIRSAAAASLPITVVSTAGSWQNLALVAEGKTCQVAIVQGDAMAAFHRTHAAESQALRRAASLYREYVHVICNRKSGVNGTADLMRNNSRRLAIGVDGSGGWITVQNWIAASKVFGQVPLVPEGGDIAAGMVADGQEASCMLFVAGLKTSAVNKINDNYGDAVELVTATKSIFDSAKDERGEPLYELAEIPAGTYPKLQPTGWLGGSKSVEVPTERAVIVVNTEALGRDRYGALMEQVGKSRARILADAGDTPQ